MRFTILIRPGEDFGYVAECPAIPGCISQGRTLSDVRRNIRHAILACIQVMNESAREKGRKISSQITQIAV